MHFNMLAHYIHFYTKEEIERIYQMSHLDMARMWINKPKCHIYFDKLLPFYEIFKERLESLGGITEEIKAQIEKEKDESIDKAVDLFDLKPLD